MANRTELLATLDRLAMEERAQLSRLEAAGKPEALDLDPTEKDQYEKRADDIDKAEKALEAFDKFEQRKSAAAAREERVRTTPTTKPIEKTDAPGPDGKSGMRSYLLTGEKRALQVGDDSKGGYLTTKEFVLEIIKTETEMAPMRQLATVRTTSKKAVQIPKRTGTFGAVWAAELATRSESTGLTYGLLEIPNHTLVAVVDVTNEMLEDPDFNIENEIQSETAEQFAVAENVGFVTGSGVGRVTGVTVDPIITNTKSGSNGDFDGDDLIDLLYGLKGVYQANATWGLNRVTMRKIRKLKANNEYIWLPSDSGIRNIAGGAAPALLGRPYVIMPEMQDTGTTGNVSVIVGDFRRGYLITDHVALQVLRDPYTQASSDLIRYWARRRVGGQVRLAEAIRRLEESA